MENEADLDSLGEQLYDLIYPQHAEMAGKLTGMLLELPGPVLAQMLQDEDMLSEALEKALGALQLGQDPNSGQGEEAASTSSDSLGEQLYELVDTYNTGHTQKITGMLLEQAKEAVLNLLLEPAVLEEQVNLALKSLQGPSAEETDMSDSSDVEDAEKLGERLFGLVEQIDPVHPSDITGMLLEMEPSALRHMLCDQALVAVAVGRAQAALESHWSQSDGQVFQSK